MRARPPSVGAMTTIAPTTAAAPPVRSRGNAANRDYFELSQRAQEAGLLGRRVGAYMFRTVLLAAALAGAILLMFAVGDSWWQLAVAAVFGILFTQAAFLGHDAAHQQIFAKGRHNEWFSRIMGNLVVGLSIAWWNKKHNRHHAHPNTIGKDGDISGGVLVFVPGDEKGRTGFMGWLAKRQGWLFIPMLSLFAFALHYEGVAVLFRKHRVKHRRAEAIMIAIRLIGFPVMVLAAMGPVYAAGFLAVQLAVFGIYMGGCFAPNHKGMPLLPKDVEVDFLRRQVLTSRNITGGRLMNIVMGGLDLQIEHHLFPRMPSANLRLVRPLVKQLCAEKGIPYTEVNLISSYKVIISYLNRVGLGNGFADPMDCPIVSQLRRPQARPQA